MPDPSSVLHKAYPQDVLPNARMVEAESFGGMRHDTMCLVEPSSEDELVSIFRTANKHQWNISPAGAGTQSGFGNVAKADLAVGTRKLNRILDYSPSDLVVTVQAGVPLKNLQATLAQSGQMLPFDPLCAPEATLGGLLATGVTGPLRTLYGTLRDMTIGLRSVFANGEIVKTGGKVVKNVAGYDMTKLFVGSAGSLAFISEITFKLKPLPTHQSLCLLQGSAENVQRAIQELIDSHLLFARMEAFHACNSDEDDPLRWTLAVESHEPARGSAVQEEALARLAETCNLTFETLKTESVNPFWSQMSDTVQAYTLSLRFSIMPNQSVLFAHQLLAELPLPSTCQLMVTPVAGVARLHVSGLTLETERDVVRHIREATTQHGGNAVIERGTPELRQAVDAFGATAAEKLLHQRVKTSIDPDHRMNPGRFLW